MTMSPQWRKLWLTIHLALSVGWIGAVVAYLVLGVSAVTTKDVQTVRAAWIAMNLTGWSAIVPLAIGSLVTGLIMSLGTPWGLFRYYWVLVTFALTVFCVVILVLHMPSVSAIARTVRADELLGGDRGGDLLHPSLGLIVRLVIMVLNVYKPQGMTPYGWRKQRERRQGADAS